MKLLTTEQVLTLAEKAAKPHAPARIGSLPSSDIADFRHAVRTAQAGSLVSAPGPCAQFDFYLATEHTLNDERLWEDQRFDPGEDFDLFWKAVTD